MPLRAAGFVIFRRNCDKIQYLLLKTSYGEKHWTPPKGHVDPGESDEQTAFRETSEESGLTKNDLKVYEDSKRCLKYIVKSKPKEVVYWLAELINPKAKIQLSSEHTEYKWLELLEVENFSKYEDMLDLLRYYNDFILNKREECKK